MALRKCAASNDASSASPLNFLRKTDEKSQFAQPEAVPDSPMEADVDIDLQEVYFLIMHFLSAGPCRRTYGQFWNELLEHQLLPRRYHAWYSRNGIPSGDENDNGFSFPLGYNKLVERYPHIAKDHLIKLLKQLMVNIAPPLHGVVGGNTASAADVPTILGSGSFSLLESDRMKEDKKVNQLPRYLRWPHMQANQVHGLSLREIGGGFTKHHRAPSIRAACYAIAKPSTMVQKIQIIKKIRGHQNAVYCAIFNRTGRYVITGSDDRLVKIWSMETAFCLSSCRGHEGDITDLAVSLNNALVASASNDCTIRVWRLPDGVPISVLRGHTGAVTAIAFSPRPAAVYQLLSSSDDGTCRIWDARNSQSKPRIYIPKPPDTVAGKSNDPAPSTRQVGCQILCCAFNANGTVFVTGSSDTYARVWSAVKSNQEDSDLPNYEMDLLSGHENDVNYVQFSGCSVPSRSSLADIAKEENLPKFKNSWFTLDNIVTCSRDGSAIIWIPRSRRSHGKVGRWTRAYHLKVPLPPMPPQPPRGGPRQRNQPTPRGVNMIVWSLDNRFVLAAIMDCRICVWNAVDGSLVHSLTGHRESTYVLDVHPFNPRIAMSAGYDGKTIVWDIWEGTPVRTYETGPFKLVDGRFSPDGTSIVVSDEVGQIYILATGQGESQKDAKYDQFFLGDYRPLIQDSHGNVLDQETQLAPHRRNLQDLLCDSSMIPYPEPYQNMYQQRRLGALGIEWRPPAVKFAVGPGDNAHLQNYQLIPFVDPERWNDPLPEQFVEMDWEQENEIQSDDTDSEYNVTDECSSEGELESFSTAASGDTEGSAEDSELDHANKESLRRSKRKKHKAEFITSSGRRVRRRNLDECSGSLFRTNRKRKSRSGRSASKRKSSTSKSSRPRRLAARNALNLFSRITGTSTDGEDDGISAESDSSDSESLMPDSNILSNESDRLVQCVKNESAEEFDSMVRPTELSEPRAGHKRRLVLKLPVRDARKLVAPGCLELGESSSRAASDPANQEFAYLNHQEMGPSTTGMEPCGSNISAKDQFDGFEDHVNLSVGFKEDKMKWGEVKARTSKRLRLGDDHNNINNNDSESAVNGHVKPEDDREGKSARLENEVHRDQHDRKAYGNGKYKEIALVHDHKPLLIEEVPPSDQFGCNGFQDEPDDHECKVNNEPLEQVGHPTENDNAPVLTCKNETDHAHEVELYPHPTTRKLRIKSKSRIKELETSASGQSGVVGHEGRRTCGNDIEPNLTAKQNHIFRVLEEDDRINELSENCHGLGMPEMDVDKSSELSNGKMCSAVYKRSKTFKDPMSSEAREENSSNFNNRSPDLKIEYPETIKDGIRQTRSRSMKATAHEHDPFVSNFKVRESQASAETSNSAERYGFTGHDQFLSEDWRSSSRMTVGLRSARNRRGSKYERYLSPLDKRKPQHFSRNQSWLMLSEHEESCRYIPQLGDEIAYLRQGHQEYIEWRRSHEVGPWRTIKGIRAVEFCRVQQLEYSTLPGSGESCCKLVLEFVESASSVFGRTFKLTLPELINFPDFLVERTRYDAAIKRNWTHRDKCQVWWRNENEEGGSWWNGRILSVKAKSSEFPDSPWERYVIQYKGDPPEQHLHSPWELHEPDSRCDHPHIDDESRDELLSSLDRLEQTSYRNQDYYGILKLKQVAHKSDFLNRFSAPLSLEVIRIRLENDYYRTLEAVKHDAAVMLANAESYFSKNAELTGKMRRLSDWIITSL
ncbi:uncharacterized protein [Aristolochia californica]|uniref:uncharacterized protein n=1 Tax=Aristolochia californica TaxID=171875 RepID=UPI0035D6EDA8